MRLETRCSAGERQKTTVARSFGMALDTSSVHGAYGHSSVWEEQRLCAWVLVSRMTCRAGRATASGTSCTHKNQGDAVHLARLGVPVDCADERSFRS